MAIKSESRKVIERGVSKKGTDISHAIACGILGAKCTDDDNWVRNHVDHVIVNNAAAIDNGDDNRKTKNDEFLLSMSEGEIESSEKVFRYRDCAFEKELRTNPKFEVVYNETIWNDCDHDNLDKVYKSLSDPEDTHYIFEALLSQVNCDRDEGRNKFFRGNSKKKKSNNNLATMDDVLSGKHIGLAAGGG